MLSQSGEEPWISAEQCVLEQAPNLAPKLKTVQLKGKAIKSTKGSAPVSPPMPIKLKGQVYRKPITFRK
jgi:hypothetical protein